MQQCSNLNISLNWQSVIKEGCSKWKTKKLMGVFGILILSSIVYHLWCARNEIKFLGRQKMEEQILRVIFWVVRSRISRKDKFKKNMKKKALCQMWNIDAFVLSWYWSFCFYLVVLEFFFVFWFCCFSWSCWTYFCKLMIVSNKMLSYS